LNALSASLGNGSIAGMATAVFSGGPGAVFWIFFSGIFGMSIRYCEVFLSTRFGVQRFKTGPIGGPMVYLSRVPGGSVLPYVYAFFCFMLSIASGNMMQANSIRLGCTRIFGVSPLVVAILLFVFMLYVMFGGAKRIVWVSDRIVPVKVGVFFLSALCIFGYHWAAIIPTLIFILKAAFSFKAIAGGIAGYTMQQAMRFAIVRTLNASEIGLGTAGVLFGGSSSTAPEKDGIMGMLSSFISANLVCTMIGFMIVLTGVWTSGLTSLELTISAYETVFGTAGGWIVTFLSMSFGLGVLVTYAYIARSCWLFVTGGRYENIYTGLFCAVTFLGAIATVDLVWNSVDLSVAGLTATNMFGILFLLPVIRQGLANFRR
jgi:AGCS family alanine or glycine:cation symporter